MNNPGAEEGMVELVWLSKIPLIVRCKRFFESTERFTPGVEEVTVNLVGLCQNSMDSRRQEFLREDGMHSGVRRGWGCSSTVVGGKLAPPSF